MNVLFCTEAADTALAGASVVPMRSVKAAADHIKKNARLLPYQWVVCSTRMDAVKLFSALRKASKTCPFAVVALDGEPSKSKDEVKLRKEGVHCVESRAALLTLLGLGAAAPASAAPAAATQSPAAARPSSAPSRSAGGSATTSAAPSAASNVIDNGRGLQYIPGKLLGSGNFGDVFQVQDYFGQHFVLKVLMTNRGRAEVEADWKKEVAFLMTLRHPNIVCCYDSFIYNGFYNLILERCEGSLRDLRSAFPDLTENQTMDITGQLLSGLHHIHSLNIVHRDLQADNVLYRRERNHDSGKARFSVKISDFGISALMQKGQDVALTSVGRDYDYAPELVTHGATSFRSDIYQVGMIVYFLLTGTAALSAQDGASHAAVISGKAHDRARQLRSPMGVGVAAWLQLDPAARPATCPAAWSTIYREVYGGKSSKNVLQ